jgi:hypothetical protein
LYLFKRSENVWELPNKKIGKSGVVLVKEGIERFFILSFFLIKYISYNRENYDIVKEKNVEMGSR